MIYFCVGLGLFSIAFGDFLDVSGDDLTMMPRMEPDLNKYIPKRGRATPCLRLIYYAWKIGAFNEQWFHIEAKLN